MLLIMYSDEVKIPHRELHWHTCKRPICKKCKIYYTTVFHIREGKSKSVGEHGILLTMLQYIKFPYLSKNIQNCVEELTDHITLCSEEQY